MELTEQEIKEIDEAIKEVESGNTVKLKGSQVKEYFSSKTK